MRPMESGEGCAGDGPGSPQTITPAPPPAASPALEPSAERASAAGQGEGSGSPCVSGPPAGACLASEAGSEAGAPRAPSFAPVHGDAQSVPSNSDAPGTPFIFQGSPAPQTTELGAEKAADIWKTQAAACTDQQPGVSCPERSTFIREQEEALCPDPPLSVKKITQEDVKVMADLLEEREWDLDTAARIGQSLVKQNGVLVEENSKLEAMLGSAREEILHLRHQVSLRDDLLQLYSDSDDDEEEEEREEEEEEEDEEEEPRHNHPYEAPELTLLTKPELPHHCPQLEALQKQLRLLEEENGQLREEVSQLDVLEEEMLILECVEQFAEASQQMAKLSEVLVLRMENYDQQQKDVTQLRTQVTSLQQRCQLYGAETEKLQQQLALEKEIQMQLQDELQDLREKYMECGGMLTEDQEDAKPLHQRAPASPGSATHSAHNAPPEGHPDYQEPPAEERRRSVRRIVLDPLYIMDGCELYCSDDQEQEQEYEAEEGSMPAEEFTLVELLVPEEDLGAIEEVVPPEDRVTEHAELVLEEAEAWEEVELELDEANPRNVVTSDLEASSLGLSHLDIKNVLQQLANWQDTHYRQQPKQKTPQKGECSHGASLQPDGQAADLQADERLPNPAAEAAEGQNEPGGQDHGVTALGADQGLSKAGAGQDQPPSHGLGGKGAFCRKGLHQQGQQSDQAPGVCCFPAACRGPTDSLKPLLLRPGQVPPPSPIPPTLQNGTPICHQPTPCPDEPEPEVEGPSHDAPPQQAEGGRRLVLQPVRRLWLLVPDRKVAPKRKAAPGQEPPKGRATSYQTEV